MNIFATSLRKRVPILFLALFVLGIGLLSFRGMPRSLFPEVNYPRVEVAINAGYAPLQTMEWGVTAVLEKKLRGVPGVRLVKSSTSRGLSSISVYLNEGEDVTVATQRVSAKVAEARSALPAAAQIVVRPITSSAFPGAEYCITSPTKNTRDLRTFVEYELRPLVLGIPGVFDVHAIGGDLPELSVKLDPRKLALRNLTMADVDDRLKNSNSVDFIGPLSDGTLAFGGRFMTSPKDAEAVVVDSSLARAVTIGDLGHVALDNAWKTQQINLNGKECVILDVFYMTGIDQQTTSRTIAATVKKTVDANPPGTYAYSSWDLNDFTDTATGAVLTDLTVGMLIIGLVTYFFLRRLRYSLTALLMMPLAAASALLAMKIFHFTINLMTLGGLTAAIGLVVDNAVIVIEMYHHKKSLAPGAPVPDLLKETLGTVARPMIYGTLTIVLVFAPIGMLSGITGMFFAPMAMVAVCALTVSVFLALFIAPGLLQALDRRKGQGSARNGAEDPFVRGIAMRAYSVYLDIALHRPRVLGILFISIAVLGLGSVKFAKTGFLPEWDEGDLVIDIRSPTPLALTTTIAKLAPLEDFIRTIPEVDFFIRKIGTGLSSADAPPYNGELVMKLKKKRSRSVFELRDAISAEAVKLAPDFELDLFEILPDRIHDLSGSAKPIVLYLRGADPNRMDDAAETLKTALAGISGLGSVRIEEPAKAPEVTFTIDEALSRARDLNPTTLDLFARFGLFSIDSSSVQIGLQNVPIRLSMDSSSRKSKLEDLPIYSLRGGLETLGKIGKVERIMNRVGTSHIDGNPVRTITAEIVGRDLGSVVVDVQSMLASKKIDGITVEFAGDYLTQQTSFRELIVAFLTGMALIFLTTLFFSERLRVALSLVACALLPPSAGLVGLVLMGIPLDVSSFTGLISVTGVAVANSLMALSAIGTGSVIEGMKSRLRPILMTNLAAMAGFAPIAIGLAQGDEILRPFSIAVIVGLVGALISTLLVMPLFYSGFCVEHKPAAAKPPNRTVPQAPQIHPGPGPTA